MTAISNSISCINISSYYGHIPFLRSDVAFNNVIFISTSVTDNIKAITSALPNYSLIVFAINMFYRMLDLSDFDKEDTLLGSCKTFLDYFVDELQSKRINPNFFKAKELGAMITEYLKSNNLSNLNIRISSSNK